MSNPSGQHEPLVLEDDLGLPVAHRMPISQSADGEAVEMGGRGARGGADLLLWGDSGGQKRVEKLCGVWTSGSSHGAGGAETVLASRGSTCCAFPQQLRVGEATRGGGSAGCDGARPSLALSSQQTQRRSQPPGSAKLKRCRCGVWEQHKDMAVGSGADMARVPNGRGSGTANTR